MWGLYIGGAPCFGDSIAPCVSVCVCGCVSVDMCMCRMKCRLPSMRHTSRHTCTHRGGGCCVRTEGTVGVLSELDLGFLSFTLRSVGVMACWSTAAVCEHIYMCVISEGVEQNNIGSYTDPLQSLSDLSSFCVFFFCVCVSTSVKNYCEVCGSRNSFSKELYSMSVLNKV